MQKFVSYLQISFDFPYYSEFIISPTLVVCVHWQIVEFGSFDEERQVWWF